ncbi:MAG TPA: hypothetical protein VIB79_06635 [Candidatus Binatia bacterium]
MLTAPAHGPYGDEAEYLAVAQEILLHGDISFETVERTATGEVTKRRSYSKFPLGQPILLVPFATAQMTLGDFLPTRHFILYFLPALESAGICALIFLLLHRLGDANDHLRLSPRVAVAVSLSLGIGTQLWPSSRTLFADQSAAFFLTLAIYALVRFRYSTGHPAWLLVAASAAGYSVLCKNIFILACPAVTVYGIWTAKNKLRTDAASARSIALWLLLGVLPFAILAIVQLWHNEIRYGSPSAFGYQTGRDAEYGFATPLLVGLYGIFLSSGRSIFLYSPLCILALFGARGFFKRAPAEGALVAGVSVPVIFVYAKWWAWHGGWEWGTRFYLFLIPVLILPSTPVWQRLDDVSLAPVRRRLISAALGALFAISAAVQILGVAIHPASYWLILANEVKIFEHSRYSKNVWEIRDDSVFPHFVPEFSPVAAHAWLLWATWNRNTLDDAKLSASAPWVSLNKQWAPRNVRPYLGYDFWFLDSGATSNPAPVTGFVFATVLLIGLGCALLKLKRMAASDPDAVSTSQRFRRSQE